MSEQNTIKELQQALEKAKETIGKQNQVLRDLTQPPLLHGTVLSINGGLTSIAVMGKGVLEVYTPPGMEIRSGDIVALQADSMQIVDKVRVEPTGETATLLRNLDTIHSEVEYASSSKVVFSGSTEKPLLKGDKVVLDESSSVIVDNLGKEEKNTLSEGFQGVNWDDIGGLEQAKKELIEAVELPHKFPEIFSYYNKRTPKGILLYGAPGCGKTMLGKAVATAVGKIFGEGDSRGFIYVKAPEILNRYVGVTESIIRQLFQQAQEFKSNYGFPAVLFIDEADAILSRRGSRVSSDIDKTIVPMFLSEMDGLEDSGALVMLVTNRPDTLDSAVVREGRVDIKIHVSRPTQQATKDIFMLNLRGVPIRGDSPEKLSTRARDEVFSPENVITHIKTKTKGEMKMTLGDIVSGSMVANLVDRASSIALQRDLESGDRSGIMVDDLMVAIRNTVRQNQDIDHKEEIEEFVGSSGEVVGIKKGGR